MQQHVRAVKRPRVGSFLRIAAAPIPGKRPHGQWMEIASHLFGRQSAQISGIPDDMFIVGDIHIVIPIGERISQGGQIQKTTQNQHYGQQQPGGQVLLGFCCCLVCRRRVVFVCFCHEAKVGIMCKMEECGDAMGKNLRSCCFCGPKNKVNGGRYVFFNYNFLIINVFFKLLSQQRLVYTAWRRLADMNAYTLL